MSKEKELTYDSAVKQLKGVKADLKEARNELNAFLKENKLKKTQDHSKDKKHGKAYKALKATIKTLEEQRDDFQTFAKENKPKKERSYKYGYPEDIKTGDDRKKFRTKMRAKAKAAGVTPDEYLTDMEGYDKKVAATKADKKAAKKKPAKKDKADKAEKSKGKKGKGKKKKKQED